MLVSIKCDASSSSANFGQGDPFVDFTRSLHIRKRLVVRQGEGGVRRFGSLNIETDNGPLLAGRRGHARAGSRGIIARLVSQLGDFCPFACQR